VVYAVTDGDEGQRLDTFLAGSDQNISRNRFKALIKSGFVSCGGRTVVEPNSRVNAGASYVVVLPPPEDPTPEPEAIALTIVFEDDDLIVIDKPAGLVVHPAAGNWTGTLVNALIHHCADSLSGVGGVRRPGIVHRLDKDTTGLLVVAKNDLAHRGLANQFADHGRSGDLERDYVALVWGSPTRPAGTIESLIGRDPRNRQKQAIVKIGGKLAITHYKTMETFANARSRSGVHKVAQAAVPVSALLSCRLETGRTHQIRVHMADIGHPLLGDPLYGAGFRTKAATLTPAAAKVAGKMRRQALHAETLGFRHPRTEEKLLFQSKLPDDMTVLIDALRGAG